MTYSMKIAKFEKQHCLIIRRLNDFTKHLSICISAKQASFGGPVQLVFQMFAFIMAAGEFLVLDKFN